ncbi:hypothetical protein PIIN_02213 [Serendipita indica DSM 11827]|uniref:mRNA export factor GLE1 n=1 Tax=Serendipita indica (strain DSM 11827) TaxID=1109443 RepID=G4TAK4_SERID|nr:hypothetical protein PIIN_02213 [Serendipita indica DSM 11827]
MKFGISADHASFPERAKARLSSSTYKAPSDSEESTDEYEAAVIEPSDSEDSFYYASDEEIPSRTKTKAGPPKTATEQRELTEAMASVKLHTEYQDPLEAWIKQNQQEAFQIAQNRMKRSHITMRNLYMTATQITQTSMDVSAQEQQRDVERVIRARQSERERQERLEQERWEARNKALWEHVDKAAAIVEARLEAERQAEEAKRRQAEAEARRIEEEKQKRLQAEQQAREKAEAEKRRIAEEKARAAEEEKKRVAAEKAAEEKERLEAEAKQQREKEALSKFEAERKRAGLSTPREDWDRALEIMQNVKHGHLKRVKEDSVARRQWNGIRRNVTLRIGQLTDNDSEVARISTQIFELVRVLDPSTDIYPAALSALAKAIVLQAETEVTAKLDTAGPLAAVVINLFNLPGFDEVLWSRMVTRTGGWVIGHFVTKRQGQNDAEFRKLAGYREDETQVDRQTRIGGVISLYFAICTSPKATSMLPTPFWPTKIWSFLSRIMGDARLTRQSMAPYLMHSCLEMAAGTGLAMFGRQWLKLLIALGQSSMEEGRMGASDDAGKTARVRLQLRAEKLLGEAGVMGSAR